VDHPRHPPLPRPALAVEQHGGPLALRQETDLVGEILHARRAAERVEPVARRALHQQGLVDPSKPGLVGHPRGGRRQVLHVDRLGEEVLGSELHRADGDGHVGLRGEQDDRGVPLPEAFQHLHAVDPGKEEVEDDHLGPEPVERGEPGLAAQLPGDLVAQPLEIVADTAQNIDVIIDEKYGSGHAVDLDFVTLSEAKGA
jgi:hypothetical protein